MTNTQRNAILSPAQGLLIFQTDGSIGFYYYSSGWKAISSAASGYAKTDLSNLASNTAINSNLIPSSNNQRTFGSSSKKWKKGYFSDTVFVKNLVATDSASTGVRAYGGVYGVVGISNSNYGVYGNGGYTGLYGNGGVYGVYAFGASYGIVGSGNYGVYGSGTTYGVFGSSSATDKSGVYGSGTYAFGVQGNSSNNYGGYFTSTNLHGIYAKTSNTNPAAYAAVFQGNTYCYGTYSTSDERVKSNIKDFKSAMGLLNQLKPKTYEFRSDEKYTHLNLPKGDHFGLLAQDVEKLFPGLVREAPLEVQSPEEDVAVQLPGSTLTDASVLKKAPIKIETMQVKAINYTELIPIMAKGMQELDAENTSLKKQFADMQNEMAEVKQLLQKLTKQVNPESEALSLSDASLQQNQPNPFADKTIIPLNVPANARQAIVTLVATGTGKIIKTITVTPGSKQISVDASLLSNGGYTYTLVVDGKKIESRQMTVAR